MSEQSEDELKFNKGNIKRSNSVMGSLNHSMVSESIEYRPSKI